MPLFYTINSWAGRSEWLDASLRFFYVSGAPLLATILLALLFLWPQREDGSTPFSRRRLLSATVLSLTFSVLVVIAINAFQKQVLGGVPISPRPFMTHWVNLLVVEPNGNTFPCFEVMLAAAAATLIWAIAPNIGICAWLLVCLLGFARIYCGSNYLADSLAGATLGGALSTLALAICRVPLRFPIWRARVWQWRPRYQGALASVSLLALTGAGFACLWNTPAQETRVRAWLGGAWTQSASAAPAGVAPGTLAPNAPAPTLHENIHEGEGGPAASTPNEAVVPGQMLLDSRAARLDGHLPQSEKYLRQTLETLRAPYPIVGVNVAQVQAGTSDYRVTAIRFQVDDASANASAKNPMNRRARVAQTAAELVKRAFQADAQLQHVDVIGIARNIRSTLPANEWYPPPKWKPVFTASIERRDLVIRQTGKPRWVNDPRLDGGSWLRARSLLYIDAHVLPAAGVLAPKVVAPKSAAMELLKPAGQISSFLSTPQSAIQNVPQTPLASPAPPKTARPVAPSQKKSIPKKPVRKNSRDKTHRSRRFKTRHYWGHRRFRGYRHYRYH